MEFFLILKTLCSLLAVFFIGYVPVYFLFEYKKERQKGYKKDINTGDNTVDHNQHNKVSGFSGFYGNGDFFDNHNISKQIFIFFISIYFGSFIISNYLILLSLLNIKFSFLNIAVFSLVFFAAFIFIQVLKFKKVKQVSANEHQKENRGVQKEKTGKIYLAFQAIFAFFIFINSCVVVFFTFLFPIRFWDAISSWSLKGRAFFLDGSVLPFFTQHNYDFSHLSYPLYISLSQTWVYIWLGETNETLVKVIFPLFYLSLIFIIYYLLRKEVKRLYAVISVFILSALPVIMDHGYLEYTNLIFSVILLSGVYYFYIYILKNSESQKNDNLHNQIIQNQTAQSQYARALLTQNQDIKVQALKAGQNIRGNLKNLIISAVFFAILASIRTEGIFFLVIFLIINTAYNLVVLFKRRSNLKICPNTVLVAAVSIILPAVLLFLLLSPWAVLQAKLNISGASTEWVPVIDGLKDGLKNIFKGSLPGGLNEISSLFSFNNAFNAFAGEFLFSKFDSAWAFLGSSYGIVWIALAVMAAFNFKKLFKAFNWIFFVFLTAGFIALFISLGFIPEFAWSTERYMLHLFPLAYFWIIRSYLSNTILFKSSALEK